MNYQTLKAELANDEYINLSYQEAAAALNTLTRPGPIPSADVRRYLHVVGRWPFIKAASIGVENPSPEKQIAAIAIVDALDHLEFFDLSNEAYRVAVTTNLDAAIQAGLLEEANKVAILGMDANRRSRADELGLPTVTDDDVARARARG